MDTRGPVDLLPDRKADTLADWLRAYPGPRSCAGTGPAPTPTAFGGARRRRCGTPRSWSDTGCPGTLVAFRGNFYSVPPGLAGATVTVRHRLGETTLEIRTVSGVTLARHHVEPDGAGTRHDEHVVALERAVLDRFTDRAPCRRKERRPPSAAALAEATRLRGQPAAGEHVVVHFADYITAAAERRGARFGEEPGR